MASRKHRRFSHPINPRKRNKPPTLGFVQLEDRSVPSGTGHDHDIVARVDLAPAFSLSAPSGFLTGPQAGEPRALALVALAANAKRLGLQVGDVSNPVVDRAYTDFGQSHVYFKQRFNGLEVINTHAGVHFTAAGELITINGGFVPGLSTQDGGSAAIPTPLVSPTQALYDIAAEFGYTIKTAPVLVSGPTGPTRETVINEPELSDLPITLKLAYVYTDEGVRPVWNTNVRTPDGEHWFHVGVDTQSGDIPFYLDWVADFSAGTYNAFAFPVESPQHGNRTFEVGAYHPTFSPFGWHDTNGKDGAEFTDTRGNNVFAQEDQDDDNFGGARPEGGLNQVFDNPFDPTTDPGTYVDALVTNLFFSNNRMHDIHAAYGFTEAAGNFQQKNYSGNGLGFDAVRADAIDGSGVNNANFGTPPDGQPGRMQMYRFTLTTPNRDSDLDNGVIAHELGHGVSNRLTGNASGLGALQSGGMGEGWSDFWALMFTQKAAADTTTIHGAGTYVLGQPLNGPGIRAYPYTFNIADMALETFNAYGTGTGQSVAVHWAGTRWASTLWDINHLLIQKHGYDPDLNTGYDPSTLAGRAGNKLTLRLVMDGLKLQPSFPSFLEARDAILAADRALTGGVNQRELWTAFARRGLGSGASTADGNSTTLTTSFALPPEYAAAPGVIAQTPNGVTIGPPAPGQLTLTFSEAMNPATFDIAADIASFTGPGGKDLKANITSASWINGNVTLQINFTPVVGTAAEGQYTLVLGPNIQANDNSAQMDQDLDGTAGEAVQDQYTSVFGYDSAILQVVSVLPADGGAGDSSLSFIEYTFSEAVDAKSLNVAGLQLSQGTVDSVVQGALPNVVRYNISGLGSGASESPLYMTLKRGAVNDLAGFANTQFNSFFTLDIDIAPYPIPLTRVGPFGWGAYQGGLSPLPAIGSAIDTDRFTLTPEAGSRLSVVVTPNDKTLRPVVDLLNKAGIVIASFTAPAPGAPAFLNGFQSTAAEQLTIRVGGAGGTTGRYQLQAIVGAGLEAEAFGGPSNNKLATAQSLVTATTALPGGATIATVVGKSLPGGGPDEDHFSFDLTAGQVVSIGVDSTTTTVGLQLFNSAGDQLAVGTTGAANFKNGILGFVAPTAGTYIVDVGDTNKGDYVLTVVRGGTLERESNDTTGSAQILAGAPVVVGALDKGNNDWFEVNVPTAGGVIVLETATPGDGPGEPGNTLDAKLEVFTPDSIPLRTDDNSAADKRNASIRVTGVQAGAYRVRLTGVNGTSGEYVLTAKIVPNLSPTSVSASGPYTIAEGASLTLTATGSDPDGDAINFSWDLNGDGAFGDATGANPTVTWAELNALGITGGPATFNVQVRASDGFSVPAPSAPTSLTVTNVNPTAKFAVDAPVDEGESATVRFTNVIDPSPAANGAGFRYSYDFNNDGVFDFGTGTYAGSVTAAAAAVPVSILGDGPSNRLVRARVLDFKGGFTDYTAQVKVLNAPPTAELSDDGPVDVGTPITITFLNATDPSPADVAAGLSYSFDFNNDGDFTDPGDVSNSATPAASFLFPAPGTYKVAGRVADRDGGFKDLVQTVSVLTVPPTATFTVDNAQLAEGGSTTVRFTGATHPSQGAIDAGFRFAYDFDNDGVFNVGDGTYGGSVSESFADLPPDVLENGPVSRVVRGRVMEINGGFTDYTATIVVTNVAPTAKLSAGPVAPIGTPVVVRFSGALDPSPTDLQDGLLYSFDFDNDGDFTSPGDVAGAISPTAGFAFRDPGQYVVRGRVADRDGGFSDSTTTVTVSSVPPTAEFTVFAPGGTALATEGDPVTLRMQEATHPSPAVLGAGLRFAYDFDNDGKFDVGDGTYAGSGTAVTAAMPQTLLDGPANRTVRARVIESSGLFTDYTAALEVLNAAPTATLVGPTDAVPATIPLTVTLDAATDGSPADLAAGLAFSFDFNNDGDFTDAGDVADGKSPSAAFAYTAPGFYTLRARVADRDGAFTDYTLPVQISVPPGTVTPGERWTSVGAGAGGPPQVRLLDRTGADRFTGMAFETSFTGGVRVATGDINGDGVPDMAVGTGPGRITEVRVLDGRDGRSIFSVQPFESSFTGGVYVSVGDVNGDGRADVAISPDEGGGPRVDVYSGDGFGKLVSYFGIQDPNFRGGARSAFGDVNGDKTPDLVVAAGFLGGPRVSVWDGKTVAAGNPQTLFNDFFVFEQTLRNGVFIASGDLDGDGFAEVIAGGGPGGGPRVFALSGAGLLEGRQETRANFFAGDPNSRGGVRVTAADFADDNLADIQTGAGDGAGSRVVGYRGADVLGLGQPAAARELDAFSGFAGGVYVG